MTAARRVLFTAVSFALAFAPAVARAHPILLVADSTAYAAWGEAEGARAGRRAVLRDRSGTALDTLEVRWARGAIAALGLGAVGATTEHALDPLPANADDVAVRGRLRVPIGAEPATVDPLYVTTLAEKQMATQMFQGLVRLDSTLTPRPALAASWSAEHGGRHVFRLRPDARFHSGRPLRATDVVATLERALAPAAAAPRVEELAAAIEGGVA
ncbi:MAG: ABC transporter substrate-binding protein, partial [Candidatus Eisenbacteria bacterium]